MLIYYFVHNKMVYLWRHGVTLLSGIRNDEKTVRSYFHPTNQASNHRRYSIESNAKNVHYDSIIIVRTSPMLSKVQACNLNKLTSHQLSTLATNSSQLEINAKQSWSFHQSSGMSQHTHWKALFGPTLASHMYKGKKYSLLLSYPHRELK